VTLLEADLMAVRLTTTKLTLAVSPASMTYSKYIGIPFEYGGRDYKSLDCYGLVMLIYKEIHNVDIPEIISPNTLKEIASLVDSEIPKWKPSPIEQGSVIVFNIKGYGSHVAYMIDNDRMIHTWEKTGGVTIERISLGWKNRVLGSYKYVR
jgi:cell wall-associated NlpC family hydrolase